MEANQERNKLSSASQQHLSFPQKVYNLLKLCEEQGREDIFSWVKGGTAIRVNNVHEFERDLLPRYFDTSKYYTFTRALSAHGFTCVRTGRQTGIYSHPNFNRNDPLSPSLMKRKIKKGSRKEATLNQDTDASNPGSETLSKNRPGPSFSVKPSSSNFQQISQFSSLHLDGTKGEDDSSTLPAVINQEPQRAASQIADWDTSQELAEMLPSGSELSHVFDSSNSEESVSADKRSYQNPTQSSTSKIAILSAFGSQMAGISDAEASESNRVGTRSYPHPTSSAASSKPAIAPNNSLFVASSHKVAKDGSEQQCHPESQLRQDQDDDDLDPIPL